MTQPKINDWIKTPCGRAKYEELSRKTWILSQIRLIWFVLIAMLRDWNLKNPEQLNGSKSWRARRAVRATSQTTPKVEISPNNRKIKAVKSVQESSQEIINKVMPIKSKINCHNQNINEILSKIEEESSKTEDASYDPNVLKIYSDEEFERCVRTDQDSIRVNIVPKKYL